MAVNHPTAMLLTAAGLAGSRSTEIGFRQMLVKSTVGWRGLHQS